jgi:peptidoglycan hydrolase-like protein with peptidoglycan-binding domain
MAKKVIRLTENDLTNLVKRVISEQNVEREFVRAIQRFLISKKITGDNRQPLVVDGRTDNNLTSQTAQAISKYQAAIGCRRSDGVWGEETWSKMPPKDKQELEDFVAEEGGFIDQFINWIGKKFRG